MMGTLVEISGQKESTSALRLERAWSFSEGWLSFSMANSPPAELTIVAAAAMVAVATPPPLVHNLENRKGNR